MTAEKVDRSGLPEFSTAFQLACQCLDLTRSYRGKTSDPTGKLRQRIYRLFNRRIQHDSDPTYGDLNNKFFETLRKHHWKEFGHAYDVADELALTLLSIYRQLAPGLNTQRLSKLEVMWALAKHVFAPTLFLIFARHKRAGLGREFEPEMSWYLPLANGVRIQQPFQRVFDYWMRTAGFGSTNRLATVLVNSGLCPKGRSMEALRKKFDRWRSGEETPVSVTEVYWLLDALSFEVAWLADPGNWKARFTLALAMQRFFEKADDLFAGTNRKLSLTIVRWVTELGSEPIFEDDSKVLAQPATHFAVHLIQKRLQEGRQWSKLFEVPKRYLQGSFKSDATREQIEQWRMDAQKAANVGNRVADLLRRKGEAAGRIKPGDNSVEAYLSLQNFILELGLRELEKLLRKRMRGPGGQPTHQA